MNELPDLFVLNHPGGHRHSTRAQENAFDYVSARKSAFCGDSGCLSLTPFTCPDLQGLSPTGKILLHSTIPLSRGSCVKQPDLYCIYSIFYPCCQIYRFYMYYIEWKIADGFNGGLPRVPPVVQSQRRGCAGRCAVRAVRVQPGG